MASALKIKCLTLQALATRSLAAYHSSLEYHFFFSGLQSPRQTSYFTLSTQIN